MRHRFVLMREGYASVTRDPGRLVHGLLWDLALSDVAALDRYEAVGQGLYSKLVQPVMTQGGTRRALVYVGSNAGPGRPHAGYLELILSTASALGFPDSYIGELRQFLPGRERA